MGARSRTKGKRWERSVAQLLRGVFPATYRARQDRRGGAGTGEGADVEGTPFWIECKHHQVVNHRSALRQARAVQAERGDSRPRVAVCKEDRPPPDWRVGLPLEPPTAVMELAAWIALVDDWARLKRAAGEPLELPVVEGDGAR